MISESDQSVFYVGSEAEVAHHAAPLIGAADHDLKIEIVSADEVTGRAKSGDLAIFFSEHFDRFRDACSELKKKRCATLYAIDGILEWRNAWENKGDEPACPWTMRPVLAHKVACIGPSQARVLNSWGNSHKTEIVGLPRLDELFRRAANGIARANSSDDSIKVLVMTAKCPGFTDAQIDNARRGLNHLKQWFETHREISGQKIEPVWRLTGDLDKQLGVENQLSDLSGVELRELLTQVDAMITTPSTTMLEGMITGVPVALLEYNQCPIYVPAAWEIPSQEAIDSIVRELTDPPKRKLDWQATLLDDHLSGICEADGQSSGATERMIKLIQSMLKVSRDTINADVDGTTELEFPAQVLQSTRIVCANDSKRTNQPVDLHGVFPDRDEFKRFEVVELQSQLAHSRREIDHRQALLDQANKELAQAHEILFSIEKHPIAGPIVRARRKLLKWFRKDEGNDVDNDDVNSKESENQVEREIDR